MKTQALKGMRDLLPNEQTLRDYIQGKILETYRASGFERISTPMLEDMENLDKSDGGDNLNLIFKVLKRGDKLTAALNSGDPKELSDMGLRYDLTLPLSRFYAANKDKLPHPFKVIQTDRVFRAERPQKGRLREFVQCDIDILGDESPNAEVELIDVTTRALLGSIAAALFLLLAMLTMQGMAGYVFPNFYGSAAAQSTASLLRRVLILLVCAPFASKLASRFGKKELATVSCIVATVLEVICFVLKPANVWVYVGFYCAAFICLGFFNTIIWAMITDVIDDSEVRNGIREDGTIYAVYSFARKLGQAFSSGLTGGLLTMIGYSAATAFDPEVTMGIFNISCIAPAIGCVAVALSLFFIYPLTKQKVEENVAALAQRHNK